MLSWEGDSIVEAVRELLEALISNPEGTTLLESPAIRDYLVDGLSSPSISVATFSLQLLHRLLSASNAVRADYQQQLRQLGVEDQKNTALPDLLRGLIVCLQQEDATMHAAAISCLKSLLIGDKDAEIERCLVLGGIGAWDTAIPPLRSMTLLTQVISDPALALLHLPVLSLVQKPPFLNANLAMEDEDADPLTALGLWQLSLDILESGNSAWRVWLLGNGLYLQSWLHLLSLLTQPSTLSNVPLLLDLAFSLLIEASTGEKSAVFATIVNDRTREALALWSGMEALLAAWREEEASNEQLGWSCLRCLLCWHPLIVEKKKEEEEQESKEEFVLPGPVVDAWAQLFSRGDLDLCAVLLDALSHYLQAMTWKYDAATSNSHQRAGMHPLEGFALAWKGGVRECLLALIRRNSLGHVAYRGALLRFFALVADSAIGLRGLASVPGLIQRLSTRDPSLSPEDQQWRYEVNVAIGKNGAASRILNGEEMQSVQKYVKEGSQRVGDQHQFHVQSSTR